MRLLILTTGNNFTPSMLYKENYIIKAAKERGDEVIVFANKKTYIKGKSTEVSSDEVVEGYTLKRFPYVSFGVNILTSRIRKVAHLEDEIISIHPDLIFINCAQVYNVSLLGKIKARLPRVKIVMDFSTKYLNSAKNWLSKNVLHNVIYRHWIQKGLPYVDKVFYISKESMDFAMDMYGIPEYIMEHNNLPGETIPEHVKESYKKEIQSRLNLRNNQILILYSGKIYPEKKVDELVKAFVRVPDDRFRLLIIGVYVDESSRKIIEPIIKSDRRITFMDFVSGDELTKFVCAADLYVQPGSISQTCQTAICCGTPLCFNDIPTHREIYNGNGFFVENEQDLYNVFSKISCNPEVLTSMGVKSYEMARAELDYRIIYSKILKSVQLDS